MGAEKGIFHAASDAHPEKWDDADIREYLYDSVRRIDAYARDRGLEACVENVMSDFLDVRDFPDLFEQTDASVCLDTGHAYVTGLDATAQAERICEWGDRISHVHLNDLRYDTADEHLPVGFGTLDFGAIATSMDRTGWTGTCTHEVLSFGETYAVHGKTAFD